MNYCRSIEIIEFTDDYDGIYFLNKDILIYICIRMNSDVSYLRVFAMPLELMWGSQATWS